MSDESEKTELNRIPDEKGRMVFPPGVSGNPAGRPKGSFSLVEMIKKKLQEIPEGKDKTYAEYFIEQMMKKTVVEGDVSMMKDIINRVDGMPKQAVDVTTNGESINDMSYDRAREIIAGKGSDTSDSKE